MLDFACIFCIHISCVYIWWKWQFSVLHPGILHLADFYIASQGWQRFCFCLFCIRMNGAEHRVQVVREWCLFINISVLNKYEKLSCWTIIVPSFFTLPAYCDIISRPSTCDPKVTGGKFRKRWNKKCYIVCSPPVPSGRNIGKPLDLLAFLFFFAFIFAFSSVCQ